MTMTPAHADTDGLSSTDYRSLLALHWWRIAAAALVCAVLAGAVTVCSIPRTYRSTASLLLPTNNDNNASPLSRLGSAYGDILGVGLGSGNGAMLYTYKVLFESRRIRTAVATELRLQRLLDTESLDDAAQQLKDMTRVTIDPKSNLITLEVSTHGTPRMSFKGRPWGPGDLRARQLTADIINSYIRHVHEYENKSNLSMAKQSRVFIGQQKANVEQQLKDAERRLETYQMTKSTILPDEELKGLLSRETTLQTNLTESQITLAGAAQKIAERRHQTSLKIDLAADTDLSAVLPELAPSLDKLQDLEYQLSVKREQYAEAHPEVQKLLAQITNLKTQVKKQFGSLQHAANLGITEKLADLYVDKIAADAAVKGAQQALSHVRAQIDQYPALLTASGRLQRDIKLDEQTYTMLAQEYEKAAIDEAKEVPALTVLDAANVPRRKSEPSGLHNALLGLLLGALLGLIDAYRRGAAPAVLANRNRSGVGTA